MLKILMICSCGISTSLLIKKMEEAAKKSRINAYVWATSEADMEAQIPQCDIVLLGPQSRYLQEKAEDVARTRPVLAINLMAYSTMDGDAVFKEVMEYFKTEL